MRQEEHIKDYDKCRLIFDMLPVDVQQRHDELLDIAEFPALRKKLVSMTMRERWRRKRGRGKGSEGEALRKFPGRGGREEKGQREGGCCVEGKHQDHADLRSTDGR